MHANREHYTLSEYQDILMHRWNTSLLWLGKKDPDGLNQLWFAKPVPKTVWLSGKPRKKYYDRIYYKLRSQLNLTSKRYTFATLTYDPGKYSPETAALQLPDHIKEFMRLCRKRYGKLSYFWIIELQKNGMPHLHIVFDKFVFWKVLRAIWYKVTRCRVTDIREVPAGNLSAYIAKYVSKTAKLDDDDYAFLFKNCDRLWNSSRSFFTVLPKPDKVYIALGFSNDCYFKDEIIYRPTPETEFWEIDYDQALALLSWDSFIPRSLRSQAGEFISDLFALFPNQVITDCCHNMEMEYDRRRKAFDI